MNAHQALRLVEAAYRVADETEGWLAGVLEAATPLADRGGGLQAYTYAIPAPRTLSVQSRLVTTAPTPVGFSAIMRDAPLPPPLVPGFYCTAPAIGTLREHGRALRIEDHPEHQPFEIMRAFGMHDMVGIVAYDPAGFGLLMCAPADRVLAPLERAEVERWELLRAHLLAGLRLQRAFGLAPDPAAVIDPTGRVVHAEGTARGVAARDALRRRAMEIDRARTAAGRSDPEGSLRAWMGLVEGRWSLVDVFDRDGRRFFIARRNDSPLRLPRPLSARERQVLAFAALGYSNKQIAYTLGLAPSTISSHLRTGMRRVGVRDIGALADVFRVRTADEEPS